MFPPGGYLAVSFFFVLSGFSMTVGYHNRIFDTGFSYSSYIIKRLVKFYPIHWLVLFYFIVSQINTPFSQNLWWAKYTTNFLLVQSFVPIKSFYFSFNSPSWYLCNTLFYCIFFPVLLKFICRLRNSTRIAILLGLVLSFVVLAIFLPQEYHHAILYVNPFARLLDFMVGIYTALFFLNYNNQEVRIKHEKYWLYGITILCLFLVAFFSFHTFSPNIKTYVVKFYWVIFSPMVLTISLISVKKYHLKLWGGVIIKVLRWIGGYSFTFYMVHVACIGIVGAICNKFSLDLCLTVVITFIVTMTISIIIQKMYVEPIANFLNKRLSKNE